MISPGPAKYCANSSPASPSPGGFPVTATATAPSPTPNTAPAIPPSTKPKTVAPIPVDPPCSARRRRPCHCAATSPATLNSRMATSASPRSNVDPVFQRNCADNSAMNRVDVAPRVDQDAAFGSSCGNGAEPLAQALVECLIESFESVGTAGATHRPAQSIGAW